MDSPPYVTVARVVSTHGVKGEISVAPTTTYDLDRLVGDDVWIVPPVRLARPYRVASIRPGPKGPLMTLEGIVDVDYAQDAIGHSILVPSDVIGDEFLVEPWDPIGYRVEDAERGFLGTVEELIITGANDVWTVRGPLGEVLIPVIEDVVDAIDEDTRTIRVHLLPGLIGEPG